MRRRWLFTLSAIFLAMLVSGPFATGAWGADVREGAFEVGAFGGLYIMEGNQWVKDSPVYGGRLGYFIWRDLSFEFSASYIPAEYSINAKYNTVPSATTTGFNFSAGNGSHLDWYQFRFEFLYHFKAVYDRFVPYLAMGTGMVLLDSQVIDKKLDTQVTAGLGMKIFLIEDLLLRLDTRYVLMLDNWIRLVDTGLPVPQYANGIRYNNLEATAGLSYLIGGKAKDSDKDGVDNDMDACPDTPAGVMVDAKGCPMDSDGDYVFDGIDQCPGTPVGAWVDSKGCPRDSDGDGILDGLDMCADTPLGTLVNEDGCPLDSDGDGVFDGIDQCPGTATGCIVDDVGCPPDADGDGVCDALDQCPDSPPGQPVSAIGCPVDATLRDITQDRIFFALNSAKLDPKSHLALDEVAEVLLADSSLKVEIGGHTDSSGSAAYNKKLSQQRAESVKAYEVGKGVPAAQMTAVGYGEAKPIATNKTTEGRAQNRRIDFKVLSKGGFPVGAIFFLTNSAKINPKSMPALEQAAELLKKDPNMKVEIGGHTDSTGPAAYNKKLSQQRADSVKKQLVGLEVPEGQMTTVGYGEASPIATNKTTEGRAENRRIEFKVLSR